MGNVEFKELTADNITETLSQEKKSVVIFTAPWCGPCKAIKPRIPEIASSHDVKSFWIDLDKNHDLAVTYNIQAVPFIVTFKEGRVVESFATNSAQKIEEMVSSL